MIVGLDVGGTNIDAIIIKDHQIISSIKVPVNYDDLTQSILFALDFLFHQIDPSQIKDIHLSTTISTNAIINDALSSVGLIIQSGPGANIKPLFNDLDAVMIDGSINHQGIIVKNYKKEDIDKAVTSFISKGIHDVSITSKFSTRNPQVELQIKKEIQDSFEFITCGHELSDQLNFPRRIFTSYLNAAVHQSFAHFYKSMINAMKKYAIDAPISILKADGGTMGLNEALHKPIETVLSGPAASLMGMMALLPTAKDAICLDIGGTTTDIFFLADGVLLFEPQGATIKNYQTLVRAISCTSIGLGGDSKVTIKQGLLQVGPENGGKGYARGGKHVTVRDACVVLKHIHTTSKQEEQLAIQAMETLGLNKLPKEVASEILDKIGLILKQTIDHILQEINSKPVYTIKELLENKTIDPKVVHMIGAPAQSLAFVVKKAMKLEVVIPKYYDVANAIGAAYAHKTMEITLVADTSLKKATISKLAKQYTIPNDYSLEDAKNDCLLVLQQETSLTLKQLEIVEASSFLMVRNGNRVGNTIRVKAQVKPGYLTLLEGGHHE